MTKAEHEEVLSMRTEAYYSGYNGIEIKKIEYGIENYVIYVSGAFGGEKGVHRSKIYTGSDNFYFMYRGHKINLDECIRC